MVDYTGLENRRAERHRGFESLSLRKNEISTLVVLISFFQRASGKNRHGFAIDEVAFAVKRRKNPSPRGSVRDARSDSLSPN